MAWKLKCKGVKEFRGAQQDANMMELIEPKNGDLQKADFVGSGVLMFPAEALRTMKRPWFYETIDYESMQRSADMDSKFTGRLRSEVGLQLWVDTTIEVGHLHMMGIDATWQTRFADWDQPGVGDPQICRFKKDMSTYVAGADGPMGVVGITNANG